LVDGQLYFLKPKLVVSEVVEDLDRWKLVLPREYRNETLRESHDAPQAGHLGVEKTYQRVAVNYFWPNLFRDVANYIRTCDTCVSVLKSSRRVPQVLWDVISRTDHGP